MAEKKKMNFLIPAPVFDLFSALAKDKVGTKEQWQVASAALLAFAELGDDAQNDAIRRVRDAEGPGGSWDKVLDEVKEIHAKASMPEPSIRIGSTASSSARRDEVARAKPVKRPE